MAGKRRGPKTDLVIQTAPQHVNGMLAVGEPSASACSSAATDDAPPFSASSTRSRPRSLRNIKSLSLNSSAASLADSIDAKPAERALRPDSRPPSVASSSAKPIDALAFRKEELGSPSVPYRDGAIEILPRVWLGSEDNARDWPGLRERGISNVLNVAKEVASPFDANSRDASATYYPPHPASGRPGIHYLKLMWSHGQQSLVDEGFPAAFAFIDAAIARSEGVLIHCQCGISRSSTVLIALVMRAAADHSPHVPSDVWALKGMAGAYTFVKEKSRWIGPNMSLMYQLLEYEKRLKGDTGSPTASDHSQSVADEEEEWSRQRRLLDEAPSPPPEEEQEISIVMQEARALDKAMEDRIVARKSSGSSVASSTGSGVGMGAAWRSRYGSRKRAGSIASNATGGSVLSEDLMEEDEDVLVTGSDSDHNNTSSGASSSPKDPHRTFLQPPPPKKKFAFPRPPPTATRSTFDIPPIPPSATRSTFEVPPLPPSSGKPAPTKASRRRPVSLSVLPPVPSSPVHIVVENPDDSSDAGSSSSVNMDEAARPKRNTVPLRQRTESKKPAPAPLHLRDSLLKQATRTHKRASSVSSVSTPSQSQTLFVFPPSPEAASGMPTRTPSAMTLTSNLQVTSPALSTPRVSTFRSKGRTKSFIGLGVPPTPTTAFSRVDARGFVGL